MTPAAALRLLASAPSFVLDRLFGRPEPIGDVPDTTPESYPDDYGAS